MDITLIRHGQSEANVSGRWQGQGDSPLTEHGEAQARSLGERLTTAPVDAVFASDLTRAQQTAKALGRELTLLPQWREIDVGAWEGLTRAEVAAQFSEEAARLAEGATDVPVGGGESWEDVKTRAVAALSELHAAHEGKKVWVVSHGGLITALTANLLGISMRMPRRLGKVVNTAMTTLRLRGHQPELIRFNDTLHLPKVGEAHGTEVDRLWLRAHRDAASRVVGEPVDAPLLKRLSKDAPEDGLPISPDELRSVIAQILGCEPSRVAPPDVGAAAMLSLDDALPRLGALIPPEAP